MIVIIARLKVQPGKEEAAFEAAKGLVSSVQVEEPGTVAYICHRLDRDGAQAEMIFYEVYADGAAAAAHRKSAHMAAFGGKVPELFDASQIKIERVERVAGFVRPGLT